MDRIFTIHPRPQFKDIRLLKHGQHTNEELIAISNHLAQGTFNPADYPKITIASPGSHYFLNIKDNDGIEGRILKLFTMDCRESNVNCPANLKEQINALAAHVQGEFDNNGPTSGFLSIKDEMCDNRDGAGTAFTTGITLHNGDLTSPVVHSVQTKDNDNPVATWAQKFHLLLGDFGATAMTFSMSNDYVELCKERKAVHNSPCFGENFDTQPFFTSSQVNCSTGKKHVGGKAGDIHADEKDCSASYSMSVNLSVIRETSDMGYFWFPALDLMVKMHPYQFIIFQGVEEHRGTPLRLAPNDTTALPLNYPHDVRYNIIAYPSNGIINHTWERNLESRHWNGHSTNLFQDAQPHFGGTHNYNTWRRLEMARTMASWYHDRSVLKHQITIDTKKIFEAIKFAEDGTPELELSDDHFSRQNTVTFLNRLSSIQSLVNTNLGKAFTGSGNANLRQVAKIPATNDEEPAEVPKHGILGHQLFRLEERIDNLEQEQSVAGTEDANSQADDQTPDAAIASASGSEESDIVQRPAKNQSRTSNRADLSIRAGVNKLVAGIPTINSLSPTDGAIVPDLLFRYGSAMDHFLGKLNQTELWKNGVRAAFLQFFLEAVHFCDVDRSSVWDFKEMTFEPQSIGLKLSHAIDEAFTEWAQRPTNIEQDPKVFKLNAEELLGKDYNANIHLSIQLTEAPSHMVNLQRQGKAKAYIMLQAMWGLFIHKPAVKFLATFASKGVPQLHARSLYTDRLFSFDNKQRKAILARFEVFMALVNTVNPQDLEVEESFSSRQIGLLLRPRSE